VRALAAVLVALAAAPSGAPGHFSLRIEGEKELRATLSGPASELAPGAFRGSISVNGSTVELPIAGTVAHAEGQWRLPVVVRYADVPAAWTEGFRAEAFSYRLRGGVGGAAPREWTGTRAWKDVEVEGGRDALDQFLALRDVRLTEMSLMSSEAVGELAIRNPFAFDLRIAQADYVLFAAERQVGEGATRGMILHAGQRNVLSLPIEVDHGQLISAAGSALLSGGDVAVRLTGRLVVRLKSGDLVVPLDLSGHLTDAS
jgi:LEA14-like dessication related protein